MNFLYLLEAFTCKNLYKKKGGHHFAVEQLSTHKQPVMKSQTLFNLGGHDTDTAGKNWGKIKISSAAEI